MNIYFDGFVLEGKVLDAGAKAPTSSYYKYMDTSNAEIVFTDLIPRSDEVLQMDFEKPFEIESGQFDSVIAMNVLEHVYNHNSFISEIHRILKPGGSLIGYVPFLIPFHADPNDYFRYTHSALEKLFSDNSFSNIEIDIVGQGGLLCCSDLLYTYFSNTNRIALKLRPLFWTASIGLYTISCLLGSLGLGVGCEEGSAYLALAFKVTK